MSWSAEVKTRPLPIASAGTRPRCSNGVHTIIARARDTSGNTGDSLPVSVTVSNTQLAGLVAAYSFDEGTGTTANDSSGQGNTATLNNGVAWVAGQHGKAASFDGVNDYITIPNSASTNISGSALTLSMWINPQPLASGNSVVIGKFWNTTHVVALLPVWAGAGRRKQNRLLCGNGERTARRHWRAQRCHSISGLTLPSPSMARRSRPMSMAPSSTRKRCRQRITARGNPMNIGADASPAQFYKGLLDDLRIYSRVLTQAQIQSDMTTPVGGAIVGSPQVLIDFPTNGAQVSGIVNVTADATDDTGIASVQFYVDGVATGSPDTTDPYALAWDTRTVSNGAHTLDGARDRYRRPYDVVGAGDGERRKRQLLPERNPGDRLQSADRHQVPSRRAHAGGGARRHDQGIAAALYHARPDALPAAHQRRLRRACSRESTTSPSIRTSAPTTTITSSTR